MARRRASLHTNISTDTTIATAPSVYYGCLAQCLTTGPSQVFVYDATATATGTVIGGAYATGSVAGQLSINMAPPGGVVCDLGIHANVTCTTAVDNITIFWGPIQ